MKIYFLCLIVLSLVYNYGGNSLYPINLDINKEIIVKSFKVKHLSGKKIKLTMIAEGRGGVKIGSYAISVEGFTKDEKLSQLSGLKLINDLLYVFSNDFKESEGNLLKDNGMLDEDSRKGVFSYTLNTSQWPEARYIIKVSAMNRPEKGTYYAGKRILKIDIGNPGFNALASNNILDVKHSIIWQEKGRYGYFPSLFKLDDGRLITRFATRTNASHIDTTGGMKTMISDDNGYHWKEPENYFSIPAPKTKDGRLVTVSGGGWKYISGLKKSTLANKKRIIRNAENGSIAYLSNEIGFNTSYDNGKSWKRQLIPVPDDVMGFLQFASLRTASGLRLISMYGNRNISGNTKNTEIYFVRSVDDGKTWDFIYLSPKGMKNPDLNPSETSITELKNGDILVMMRTSGNLYSSISKDRGSTWSTPKDTGILGYPPNVVVLPDDRLLCLYGYRHNPMGIRGCISNDNGKTWDVKNELVIRNDGFTTDTGNLGYPRGVLLPNGEIFVIYYITTDGYTPYIAGTHFRIPSKR